MVTFEPQFGELVLCPLARPSSERALVKAAGKMMNQVLSGNIRGMSDEYLKFCQEHRLPQVLFLPEYELHAGNLLTRQANQATQILYQLSQDYHAAVESKDIAALHVLPREIWQTLLHGLYLFHGWAPVNLLDDSGEEIPLGKIATSLEHRPSSTLWRAKDALNEEVVIKRYLWSTNRHGVTERTLTREKVEDEIDFMMKALGVSLLRPAMTDGRDIVMTQALSLHQWMKDNSSSSFEERVAIILEMALTLAVLHRRGILHRDVKSDNFYISHSLGGAPRVFAGDFGLSSHGGRSKVVGAPPEYLPIQLAQRATHALIRPTEISTPIRDLYAFALTALEILSGQFVGSMKESLNSDSVPSWLENISNREITFLGETASLKPFVEVLVAIIEGIDLTYDESNERLYYKDMRQEGEAVYDQEEESKSPRPKVPSGLFVYQALLRSLDHGQRERALGALISKSDSRLLRGSKSGR